MQTLSDTDVQAFLADHPDWAVENQTLVRTIPTSTYLAGHDLARQLGEHAEAVDHHPDLMIGYKTVRVALTTHDAGGLTNRDTEFVAWIDEHLKRTAS